MVLGASLRVVQKYVHQGANNTMVSTMASEVGRRCAAAKARQQVHSQQRSGRLAWCSQSEDESRAALAEFDERQRRSQEWAAQAPALFNGLPT